MNRGVRFPKNCDSTSVGVLRVNFILSEMIMLLDSSTVSFSSMLKASLGPFSALDSPPILVSGSHLLIMMLTTVPIARVD